MGDNLEQVMKEKEEKARVEPDEATPRSTAAVSPKLCKVVRSEKEVDLCS